MEVLSLSLIGVVLLIGFVAWFLTASIRKVIDAARPGWLKKQKLLNELLKHFLPIIIAIVFSLFFPQWILVELGLTAVTEITKGAFYGGKIIVGILGGTFSGWSYHFVTSMLKTKAKRD